MDKINMDEYNEKYAEALSNLRRARHNARVAQTVMEETAERYERAAEEVDRLEAMMAEMVLA